MEDVIVSEKNNKRKLRVSSSVSSRGVEFHMEMTL